MLNEFNQAMTDKTKDQYKIIKEKYKILKRYLKLHFKKHSSIMTEDEIEIIIQALDDEPIKEVKESENNE